MIGPEPVRIGEVAIWLADPQALRDDDVLARCMTALDDDERARASRFRFDRNRREYVAAHALLRWALGQHFGPAPTDWRFEIGEYGRPELARDQGIVASFNLSHTDGLVACAVATDCTVGIDVEFLDRRRDPTDLADHYFAPAEQRALRALPTAEQRHRFFTLWTLKEAYIKACGLGLQIPLADFAFEIAEPPTISFVPSRRDDPEDWRFDIWPPTPAHLLALAVQRKDERRSTTVTVRWAMPMEGVLRSETRELPVELPVEPALG